MKRQILPALAPLMLLGGLQAATAADMPLKAPPPAPVVEYNWTGFYAGLNGGLGWGGSTGDLVANSGGIAIPTALAGGTIPFNLNVKPQGGLGGGQGGYNWQIDHVVLGVEGDIDDARIRQLVTITNPGGLGLLPTINTGFSKLDWLSTVRGRVGYAWNNALLYGTAGVAFGGTTDSGTSQTTTPPPFGSGSVGGTRTGWAAGAGFEWSFMSTWSFKAEYLHADLGASTVTDSFLPNSPDFVSYRYTHQYDIVRFGFNYRFNPTAIVAKY
jgi:outer membrane immunogenic protein